MAPDRLLTIGEFSRLTRISIRMLRYYDEHAVLRPTRVDAWTGHRFYSPDLLRVAGRIRALRDVGLGVAELVTCVPLLDDPAALRPVLDLQRSRLLEEADRATARIGDLDRLVTSLENEEPAMPTTITRSTLPARHVASVRATIDTYADEGRLWEQLSAALPASGAQIDPDGLAVAVFHDEDYVDHDADVEVQLSVTGPFPSTDAVRHVEVPATDVVLGTLTGSYEGIGAVMADLGTWIGEHGLQMAGRMFNIYRVSPASGRPPEEWVTDVCLPVATAG